MKYCVLVLLLALGDPMVKLIELEYKIENSSIRVRFEARQSHLESTPVWDQQTTKFPLSIDSALEKAIEHIKKAQKDVGIRIQDIRIANAYMTSMGTRWFYYIQGVVVYDIGESKPFYLVVLMNGDIVSPVMNK